MKRYLPIILIAVIIIITPLSSSYPDGLERVANDLGFWHMERETVNALFSGYRVPWFTGPASPMISAGIGAASVYFLIRVIFRSKK